MLSVILLNVIMLIVVMLSVVAPSEASTIFVSKSGSLLNLLANVGLYYKIFTVVIYNRNAIGHYYKTTIIV
jgi:hypothetical protein